MLAADGSLYTDNLRTARAADEFTTAGGPEVLEPRFTLHGFRYAEVTGYPGDIGQADITARVVHSDTPATGSFESSLPWLDQLFRTIDWSQRGNFISVPTDCPQRDERLGWLGDAQVFARTACYNRDVAAFFAKWLDDVADAQLPSGAFTDVAPRLTRTGAGAPAWGDAGVIVPWTMWKMYGDTAVLDRHFGAMTRWMDFLERANPDYLRARELGNSYNDWLAPGDDDTPHELLATAYWAHDAALMAEIADATGRPGDAAGYRALWSKIRSAFADAFVAADGQVTSGTQTAYVLGLHMNLVPDDLRAAAADRLVAAIRAAGWHLTTGFAGVGYLLPVLSSTGHTAAAYRLLEQDTMPSWRYMVDHGATTIWERWDGWTAERGFASPWMNSFNHYSLGSVGEWLYRFLLGIDQEPGTAGFGQLLLRPHPGGSLDWARGTYRSARGTISAGWKRDRGRFTYWAELPPNVTATIRIPSRDAAEVRDAMGNPPSSLASFPGAPDAQEAVFQVGSGAHEFSGPAMNDPATPEALPVAAGRPAVVRDPALFPIRAGSCAAGLSAISGLLECCVFCVAGGVPAGQQVECIGVRAAGCGTAHDEVQALVGGEFHRLVGERHVPDERVVQALGAGPVPPDFVPGPALPEGVAAGGQLADQVRQGLVVGVTADLGAQGGDVLVGDGVPVGVELGGGGVQEGEAGGVDRPGRAGEDRREQGPGQGVAGEDVQAAVADVGRDAVHRLQHVPQFRAHRLPGRAASGLGRRGGVGGADQVEQVGAFGVVEQQGAGDGVQDGVGGAAGVAALQPGVVRDADPGQQRDLLAAQARDPAGPG